MSDTCKSVCLSFCLSEISLTTLCLARDVILTKFEKVLVLLTLLKAKLNAFYKISTLSVASQLQCPISFSSCFIQKNKTRYRMSCMCRSSN